MPFLLGRTVLHEFVTSVQFIKYVGDEKKSINILCPKPSTRQVKCLTVVCVASMLSLAEYESLPIYTVMSCIH